MSKRGTCAKCGRVMQVRGDGLIRTHRDPADNRCLGGGRPPQAEALQDDDVRAELGVWLRTAFFWGINHGRETEAADALLASEPMRRLLAARYVADEKAAS